MTSDGEPLSGHQVTKMQGHGLDLFHIHYLLTTKSEPPNNHMLLFWVCGRKLE